MRNLAPLKVCLWVVAVVALGACAVPNQEPIRILNAIPFAPSVDPATCNRLELGLARGSLDVGFRQRYVTSFDVVSDLNRDTIAVEDDIYETPSRLDFEATELVFSYQAPGFSIPEHAIPYRWVIEAGASPLLGNSFIGVDLISSLAATTLVDQVQPGDEPFDLLASFRMRGRFSSGLAAESNIVTYPIRIFNGGGRQCAPGIPFVPSGPCGETGGQDGAAVACCDDPRFIQFCPAVQ